MSDTYTAIAGAFGSTEGLNAMNSRIRELNGRVGPQLPPGGDGWENSPADLELRARFPKDTDGGMRE